MGGGACFSVLYNCVLTGNWAGEGGGAYGGTLHSSIVTGNSADHGGGGISQSTVYNCTLVGNSVCYGDGGGAAAGGTLYNSILYYNSIASGVGANYAWSATLNYCCTTPIPTNGVGNITGPPLFMDMAAGDFRLWEGSACIDAGTNLLSVAGYSCEPTDILGNARFIDGNGDGKVAWDIGAYEFHSFKPPRFSVAPQLTPNGWLLNVTGAPNKWARLQRSSNLKDWMDVWSGFMGAEGTRQFTDNDRGPNVMFYRAVVQ